MVKNMLKKTQNKTKQKNKQTNKQNFSVFTWPMMNFNPKIMFIKCVFTSNLSFINPYLKSFLWFKISKKLPVISLYWFTAQQQTGTWRRKKSHSVYTNLSLEENKLPSIFENPQEMAKKFLKENNTRKT